MGIVHAKESNIPANFTPTSPKENISTTKRPKLPINMDEHQATRSSKSQLRRDGHAKEKTIDLQAVKARVDKIHVDGLMRTKDDIIKSQVMELFKAKDFEDVIIRSYKVRERLEALGCFRRIGIYIDTSRGSEATPDGVEVTFKVREMRRLIGGISTMVGNNEGSLTVSTKAPNLFGRGESIQMEYSYGSKSSSNFNISTFKPFPRSLYNAVLTGTVFNSTHDFPWSGFKQNDKGLLLDVELNPTGIAKHNIQYEAAFRNISCSKQATFRVREQCGPNLKSALRHIWTLDKRDSSIFPLTGSFLRLKTEMAGLGGDIGFLKNEVEAQSNWSPHECLTFQLGFQCGILNAFSGDMKTSIADYFFLGGPMNMRGFDMRGCGPRYEGNSVGGEMYWAAALHIYTPLPFRPGRNSFGDLFRLHGFVNGGNLSNVSYKYNQLCNENIKIFTENVRCAVGGGIAMKLGNVARVELNMTVPLLFARNDVLRQFQFGIGIQYL